jgi:hypothetical protein
MKFLIAMAIELLSLTAGSLPWNNSKLKDKIKLLNEYLAFFEQLHQKTSEHL